MTIQDSEMVIVVEDTPRKQPAEPKPKRSSFRDSFTRTFSLTRKQGKARRESLDDRNQSGSESLYIDNNEAIGASNISRPKSKSASALVDIQPWNERRGHKSDIYLDSTEELRSNSPTPIPALLPKQPEPNVPWHRQFTTPKFGFDHKANEALSPLKPKKVSITFTFNK